MEEDIEIINEFKDEDQEIHINPNGHGKGTSDEDPYLEEEGLPGYEEENQEESGFRNSEGNALSPEMNAGMILAVGDAVQAQGFGFALKMKRKKIIKGKEDFIKSAKAQYKDGIEVESEEHKLYIRYEGINEQIEKLHLSDSERDRLLPILTEYCRRHNIQMPIDIAMWSTIADIMLKRVEEVISA